MSIRVVDNEPDVTVTSDELARYKEEYSRAYMFYCGAPPSLETFIRNKKRAQKDIGL